MQVKARTGDGLDVEGWIERMIADHGYAQLSLHDTGSGVPGVAFTIGLETSRSAPELMCMGVAPDIAGQLFAACIDAHDRAAFDLAAGAQTVTGLIEGHSLRLRQVPPALVLEVNAFCPRHRDEIAAMLQLLIPDNAGRFPDEAGCDPQVAAAQDVDRLLAHATN